MISNNIMKLFSVRKVLTYHRRMGMCVFNLSRAFSHQQCTLYNSHSEMYSFEEENIKRYITNLMQEYEHLKNGGCETKNSRKRLDILGRLAEQMKKVEGIQNEIVNLKQFITEESSESEMVAMAKEDISKCNNQLAFIKNQIIDYLIPPEEADESDVLVEVTPGDGGQEAMLFAQDIFEMYRNFAVWKKWTVDTMDIDTSHLGGIRQATMTIHGTEVYRTLKYEDGVHRVQRVPKTETSGLVHTSTASVAIIPQPTNVDLQLHQADLKYEINYVSTRMNFGNYVKSQVSGVKITHLPTGLSVECQADRSQLPNTNPAILKLRALLYQHQLEEQQRLKPTSRQLLTEQKSRAKKIRTYNFNQDHVTDHRIGFTVHDISRILSGESTLQHIIDQLQNFDKQVILQQIIENSDQKK